MAQNSGKTWSGHIRIFPRNHQENSTHFTVARMPTPLLAFG